ncbi:MAG TPA: toprim domain-containing protein, partial [Clostridia bacterium]|nr:toprim domain-containing protein [Clostridia bacterium]
MTKTLLVVESPAKAKTIARYLGKDFDVRASVGHIRDLPASTLGVDVNRRFKPMYLTLPGKDKVVRELKGAAEKADRILLATDPDREGEAIAWHLAHILKIDGQSDCRIVFNEITAKAVSRAVEEARPIDEDLVNAQQSRRILDRLVGYELSPFLWQKIR